MGTAATKARAKPDRRLKTALAVAVAHPVRTMCFAILGERIASPAEISRELFIDVNQIGYHVRSLCDWGLVEEVDQRPVRGATEHFFRAAQLSELTEEEEETLFPAERRQYAETVLSMFTADAVRSLDMGLLYERTDHFFTRIAYDVDEQAWEETRHAYRECFEKVKAIKDSADIRLAERRATESREEGSERSPSRVMSFLGMFEIPPLRTRNVPDAELIPSKGG